MESSWATAARPPISKPSLPYTDGTTRLTAITPALIRETYGIPREGPYYKTDRLNALFKMPLWREFKQHNDKIDYASIEACYNKLKDFDDYLGSSGFRVLMSGEKNADKYDYQPIVRTVVEVEDTEIDFRPPYA